MSLLLEELLPFLADSPRRTTTGVVDEEGMGEVFEALFHHDELLHHPSGIETGAAETTPVPEAHAHWCRLEGLRLETQAREVGVLLVEGDVNVRLLRRRTVVGEEIEADREARTHYRLPSSATAGSGTAASATRASAEVVEEVEEEASVEVEEDSTAVEAEREEGTPTVEETVEGLPRSDRGVE